MSPQDQDAATALPSSMKLLAQRCGMKKGLSRDPDAFAEMGVG